MNRAILRTILAGQYVEDDRLRTWRDLTLIDAMIVEALGGRSMSSRMFDEARRPMPMTHEDRSIVGRRYLRASRGAQLFPDYLLTLNL